MPDKEQRQQSKPYHHGNLRQALIDAGLEMIAEGGAAQLDLRKVARKAGVSHTAPYRHFTDKKALLAALAEEGYRELASRINSVLDGISENTLYRLHAFAKEYVEFAMQNPRLMREMFSGLTIEIRAYPTLYDAVTNLFQPLVSTLKNGQENGELSKADETQLALVVWSMMHGLSILIIEKILQRAIEGADGVERMIHLCVQTLYDGLGQRNSHS